MRYRVAHRSAAARPGLTQVLDAQERSQMKRSRKNNCALCHLPASRNTRFRVLGVDLPSSGGKAGVYSHKFVGLSGQSLRDFQQSRLADFSKHRGSQGQAVRRI